MSAIDDIVNERVRQVVEEKWSADHDDRQTEGQLAMAAAIYAAPRAPEGAPLDACPRKAIMPFWPWSGAAYKPKDRRADLVRAGALILAEIERLDRERLDRAAQAAQEEPDAG